MPVVWIGRQVSRSRVTRVVISKNKAAARRHLLVGIFESDAGGVWLQIFLKVEHRTIGKRR